MSAVATFLTSTIGRKVLMALTGLLLLLFLVTHLAANLLVLIDAHAYNEYSHALVSNPLIYLAEAGLLALFVAHFVSGIIVYARGRAARPVSYKDDRWAGGTSYKSFSSSTMLLSGAFFLLFVPLHVWGFKFGTYYDAGNGVRDLHRLVVEEFQSPLLVGFYVVGMAILGTHLWHAFGSAFESLGVSQRQALRRLGNLLAVFLAGGFMIIPIAIFLFGGGQ
jgi:succinate dehydrogenase / fumarate reductase cytochrome b subunit